MKVKCKTGNAIAIISLLGTLVALATSIVAWSTAKINYNMTTAQEKQIAIQGSQLAVQGQEITKHQKEIKVLKLASLHLKIDTPRGGDVIDVPVYNDMQGTFEGDLQEGYTLWVLARDQYNFFLMYPPTHFIPAMGRWSQKNIRLGTSGKWELHVCLANENATRWFQDKADRNDWSGFPTLPEGAQTLRYVVVERK